MRLQALRVLKDRPPPGGQRRLSPQRTREDIPSVGGCYAWFLPLWILREDLEGLLEVMNRLFRYEPEPEQALDASFNWETVGLTVRRSTEASGLGPDSVETWKALISNPETRLALERILLEASLLMPPLYVGRTNSLWRRYTEHVNGRARDRGGFYSRFRQCLKALDLQEELEVRDLLFVCITTEPGSGLVHPSDELRDVMNEPKVTSLIEGILMQICRPPFSNR